MSKNRRRILLCLLGAVLAIVAIALAEFEVWRCIHLLRQRAEAAASENLHLSSEFEKRIRELNDNVFRYSLQASPERRTLIEQEMKSLAEWLASHRDGSISSSQGEILTKAGNLYASYVAYAELALQTNHVSLALPALQEQNEGIVAGLLNLAADLHRSEKTAWSQFIVQTQSTTATVFQRLILSSVVLLTMGATLGWLGYFALVAPLRSRLRQNQQVIEQQEKLSSLGVLAAGVAHEIRNPLTSIKARLFSQQSALEKNSEAFEDNVFIGEEISRLERIVADFLAFARPSEPQMVSFKVTQLFRDLERLFQGTLSRSNIDLKIEILADPEIQADPAQLKQALINLIRNAAESIGQNGVITFRARLEKRRRATRPTTVALLEVEDTGKGIPPDVQKRLFDPFFTTKANGTGLGLSIAARILEKHGGSLEFQSESNRGTLFRLVLPLTGHKT